MNIFKNSKIIITGGTGSFGNAVLQKLLKFDLDEVRIFSRDEKKQDDMRKKYKNPKIKFFLGDVRDVDSLSYAFDGIDYVFHAAALKQVPSCEFFPMDAVQTNILGTHNVINTAIACKVKKVVSLSTDKAVYPINAMGISKAMAEKVMIARSRMLTNSSTILCGTRYGNVIASRGSVIPLFLSQIISGLPITVTDPSMTRFMMTLEESVELVLFAFLNGNQGDIFVQKAPSASIKNIVDAILIIYNKENHPVLNIGTRHGEKKYETLLSREEMVCAVDMGNFYRVPADTRDLNYEVYFSEGKNIIDVASEFNSDNASRLNVDEIIQIIKNIDVEKGIGIA